MTCGREIGYTCSANPVLSEPGCGEHFGSLEAFDRHLRGAERRCMTTRMMLARGFRRKDNGSWSVDREIEKWEQTSLGLRRVIPRQAIPRRRSARRATQRVGVVPRGREAKSRESEGTDPA